MKMGRLLISVLALAACVPWAGASEIGKNTETTVVPKGAGGELFSISVDGEHVAGTRVPKDVQRKADLALDAVEIEVKFDGLDVKPILNVSTYPVQRAYGPGEPVQFLASNNYPGWIDHQEILIYAFDGNSNPKPIAHVPVSSEGAAVWHMPQTGSSKLYYLLRAYDQDGRYDETKPLSLVRGEQAAAQQAQEDGDLAPGYGEDRTFTRNIPVYGGAVTVFGRRVPDGDVVTVMGARVPVDQSGAFVVQRLLPPGDHTVTVELSGRKSKGMRFERNINIPANDWFYVALADLTVGQRSASKNIEAVRPGEFPGTFTKGRLAFYLKGKIKGRYLLTASADTGETGLKHLFSGWDAKDPKAFLRRFDPDDYYPVYGDDSTLVEDAPTRGKFYVRLARGDSHVMWGNFKTEIRGTELLRNERALYGASAVYKSESAAPSGERRSEVQVYAAQPGTLPQRDVLRGTGGSAYFLKHQDVTIGSETVAMEIRDSVTGQILLRQPLQFGKDYEVDYFQGVILLKQPLSSFAATGGVVRDGGNATFLTVSYEYSPAAGEVDGYAYGGRGQQWLGDHVRLGATGAVEKTGSANQELAGADILLRHSDSTYLEAEVAQSTGPGFGVSRSADGGLTLTDIPTAGVAGTKAKAYRAHGHVSLQDLSDAIKGDLDFYGAHKERGFSSLSEQIAETRSEWGAKADLELSDFLAAHLDYSEMRDHAGQRNRALEASLRQDFATHWQMTEGVRNVMRHKTSGDENGSRTDVGAQLQYNFNDGDAVYVFGQMTAKRSGSMDRNDRVGIGGKKALTEKVDVSAEASFGSRGIGGKARVEYSPTADDHYYLGYTLDPDREFADSFGGSLQGDDLGQIVAGVKHSYSKSLSVYAEDGYDMFGQKRSLTQTYGVRYTPDAIWTISGASEAGHIWDDGVNSVTGLENSDFDRKAFSATVGYHPDEKIDGSIKGELRFDDSEDDTRDLTAYLLSVRFGYGFDADWRALAHLDATMSDASATNRDGTYVEGSLGFAYRPTDNDRLNALFKYTYLYDLPGADQVTASGELNGPQQQSHIFGIDASYDITQMLTLGGKYGFRIGETRARDGSGGWTGSSAHLAIIRADLHVVKDWDAVVEGRMLWSPSADSTDFGAIAAIYKHFGDNFSLGAGYNFGSFSDDLRDLTSDEHGVFINAVGKF